MKKELEHQDTIRCPNCAPHYESSSLFPVMFRSMRPAVWAMGVLLWFEVFGAVMRADLFSLWSPTVIVTLAVGALFCDVSSGPSTSVASPARRRPSERPAGAA